MKDVRVALDLHVLRHRYGPRPRDPAEVVPTEVDEHDVFGALLRVALELLGQQGILASVRAARSRAGDGVGRQPVTLDLEQELRRRSDHLEPGHADEEQVRARVDPAERPVQRDPVEWSAIRSGWELERLAPPENDLDRLPGCDGVLRHLDRPDVLVPAQRCLDPDDRRRSAGCCATGRRGQLRRRRAGGPLEGLIDGALGDPVAAFEVGRLGVERGDGAQLVAQVIEHQDEVGLEEGRQWDTDGIALGQRDRRLEGADGVVGEGSDGAAREAGHALDGLDTAARHECPEGCQRVGHIRSDHGQVGFVVLDGDRSVWVRALPPRTSRSWRGPTPRNE